MQNTQNSPSWYRMFLFFSILVVACIKPESWFWDRGGIYSTTNIIIGNVNPATYMFCSPSSPNPRTSFWNNARSLAAFLRCLYRCVDIFIPPTLALKRTIGPPGDARFIRASNACDGTNLENFEFGVCSLLIACIYDNLDEVFKASVSSGTNIASLLPTILVLIGELEFLINLS